MSDERHRGPNMSVKRYRYGPVIKLMLKKFLFFDRSA